MYGNAVEYYPLEMLIYRLVYNATGRFIVKNINKNK